MDTEAVLGNVTFTPVVGPLEHSPTIGVVAAALAKAQGALSTVPRTKLMQGEKYSFWYADLAACWEACRKPLADNKLAVVQLPTITDTSVVVATLLAHESGEWFRGEVAIPVRDRSAQVVGAALTYARRYGLSALVGLASDEDLDADAIDREERRKGAPEKRAKPPAGDAGPVRVIEAAMAAKKLALKNVLDYCKTAFGKDTLAALDIQQTNILLALIRQGAAAITEATLRAEEAKGAKK